MRYEHVVFLALKSVINLVYSMELLLFVPGICITEQCRLLQHRNKMFAE